MTAVAQAPSGGAGGAGPSAPAFAGYKDGVWVPSHNRWAIALTVTLATFMEVLDTSASTRTRTSPRPTR